MKFHISINQKAVMDAGYDLDLTDMAIFDVLTVYTNSTACRRMNEENGTYFNVPYAVVIDELPLAKINKPDSMYRRFQKLEQYGIIETHPDNKRLKQVWFKWGRNYDTLYFEQKTGSKSDQPKIRPDRNPVQTGSKSGLRPDQNPALNNTNNNTSLYSKNTAPAKTENSLNLNTGEQKNHHPQFRRAPLDEIDIDSEIQAMREDQFCEERFFRQCRIPIGYFQSYLDNFQLKLKSEKARPRNTNDLRSHFFNWSTLEFKRLTETQKNATGKFTFNAAEQYQIAIESAKRAEADYLAGRL